MTYCTRDGCDRPAYYSCLQLCGKHYQQARLAGLVSQSPDVRGESHEAARARGAFICQCTPPDGPDDSECQRCRKLILTPERADFLRMKYQMGEPR
jgi:hypothetical protein